ncbi:hypothetical protein CPB86DRAFT_373413 [Serendipita vermifera]|nr:hypothetical protein CPB86DRAFT_373413 [Serendipita vermifera]
MVPLICRLTNLTSLVLRNVVMSCEVMMILSELDHLLHLSYDVPIPYCNIAVYGNCARSMSILAQLMMMERHSLYSLQFSVVTGFDILGVLKLHYPSLLHFSVHSLSIEWRFLKEFIERHEDRLESFDCLLYSTGQEDEFQPGLSDPVFVDDLPGLKCATARSRKYQGLVEQPFDSYILRFHRDASGQISCSEAALTGGTWDVLPVIGEGYHYLRILNIWDANWLHNRPHFEKFVKYKDKFSNIETLRFNLRSIDGVEPWQYIPDFWDDDGDTDWEECEWHAYHANVQILCSAFPNLRLIEWFLVDDILYYPIGLIPFWEWRVVRAKAGSTPIILRSLHNWRYCNPLSRPVGWSMTKGMSHISP